MDFTDRILPTSKGITTYLEELINKNFQIPTFQREVVWEKENVKKLWDSIYKFYPLGSILIWKTNTKLQNHRDVGGHQIADEGFYRSEYQYILDGQQRTTSLLTSLYGGKIEGRDNFNPILYIDLTIENIDEVDDENYKRRFLFWDEIDDRNGELKVNIGRKKKFEEGLILKIIDIKRDFQTIYEKSDKLEEHTRAIVKQNLWRIRNVLDNYRISFIELKGIQVSEVCQIFERINQAGKPLSIFDIVVAKTYRPEINETPGFYLRDLIDSFRKTNGSKFLDIDDLTYLQILSILINRNITDSGILNITDRYLNDIKTEQIEAVWEEGKKAFLKTFDFFENHLYLKGPQLIPFRYYYLSIAAYFYKNQNPNYNFLKQYFWFNSFHNDDLLSNTTQLFLHIDFIGKERNNQNPQFGRFQIDKNKLRTASYSSKGRLSRAILSLYANQQPKDWKNTDRSVLADVYYLLTDKPNLHHVFPTGFIAEHPGDNKIDNNSLMNIVYLTQITNIQISDKNPLDYLKDFICADFINIMGSHLLPNQIIGWVNNNQMPIDALDQFVELRINAIIDVLKQKLPVANFEVIDTK